MNQTLQNLMREAMRLTRIGQLKEATAAIQRALTGTRAPAAVVQDLHAAPVFGHAADTLAPAPDARDEPVVSDGCVFETPTAPRDTEADSPGEFTSGSHSHAALHRDYKLYIPPGHAGRRLPLVVMLHGCTQNPDDFAAGTGMNEHARAQGFFVLYPAQAQDANPSRCWNWFKHTHQRHGHGEPALLADLARTIVQQYGLDERQVFLAGLSAGGAMACITASLYPEVFAAAGIHSGLASGAATNLAEAMSAMQAGASNGVGRSGLATLFTAMPDAAPQATVPTIVFHGDSDATVHPRNGEQVIAAALANVTASPLVEQGESGRRYTRTCYRTSDGRMRAEHWLVHGAGHAWSGGLPQGSYTDPRGPDASAEMLRFFFEQPR